MKKLLSLVLVLILFVACTPKPQDLTENFQQKIGKITGTPSEILKLTQMEFGAEILKQSYKNDNTLISPLSIKLALAMIFNGADNETKSQMTSALGLSPEELNTELKKYVDSLPSGEKAKLHIANSLWLKSDNFSVKDEFLQTNVDYFNSDVFKESFDSKTVKKVNAWVKENTKNMIDKIIDRFDDPDIVMFLMSALAFEAEWADIYDKRDVTDGTFTAYSNEKQKVKMMSSTENIYLEDDFSTGFIKKYAGGNYAFVALLPKEDIDTLVASLNGENLTKLLNNKMTNTVHCKMPKFSYDFSITLNDILISMGMSDAFNKDKADFSKISETPLYISAGLHKTHITVDELGTKAGAVTAIANCGSAMPTDPKEVVLDRPFLYMIIDTQTNLPIFMGVLTEI